MFGREKAADLGPLESEKEILSRLTDIEAMRGVHREGEMSPLGEVPDVRRHLVRVSKEGILDGEALREVASVLRCGSEAAHFMSRHRSTLGEIAGRWPEAGGGEPLARRIERSIDPGGTVTDEASTDVAETRTRVRGLHGRLRRTAEDMTRSREWTDKLQEPYFSVRGDRYVLPIKASFRYQVGGIVHNVSNTGETVFIEPPSLISLGNDLAVAIAEEAEAVRMVLAELTRLVGSRSDSIHRDMECIGELDLIEASARLADDLDAAPPSMRTEEDAAFDLRSLCHPLLVLQGKKVIPNDVRLESRPATAPPTVGEVERPPQCLVVSGPNAGGKTVTVTAVALCALMLRHGLPIPAAPGSVLPIYREIIAVLGDEQDLERDLSTFSAHLEALRDALEQSGPAVLVLVDEICADTDPREGSALATAVLEQMIEKGAHVLVTTHFEALKALAAADPRFVSAAVGFDTEKMQPTYRLRLHVSGGSSAIEIAARVGLPGEVLNAARSHLSGDGGALSSALDALEARTAEADREASRLREMQAAETAEQERLRLERKKVEEERRKVRAEAREKLTEEIEAARKTVKETIAKLQAEPKMKRTSEAQQQLEQLSNFARTDKARDEEESEAASPAIAKSGPSEGQEEASKSPLPELEPGTFVRAPTMDDREGEVLDLDERTALVAFGALKMRLPKHDLVALRRPPRKAAKARMASTAAERAKKTDKLVAGDASSSADEQVIDLRGMRVEEAIAFLDKRLDELVTAGIGRARVVHGHGTGALRRGVREHLAISPHVSGTEVPSEDRGGDGATWVRLDN